MKKIFNLIESLTLFSLMGITLISFSIVILRYFFGLGWVWLQESVLYLHAFAFLFGTLKALKSDKHVRVDILYSQFTQKKKNFINALGFLLLALPVCVTLVVTSFHYTLDSWKWLEKSSDAGGLPLIFVLKTFIPLFALFFLLKCFIIQVKPFKKDLA